uniref:Uncharacterized protein n=1 Tax=Pseudonaja textilis TaxID=8673 RepID=A0A670ZE01_PSETE
GDGESLAGEAVHLWEGADDEESRHALRRHHDPNQGADPPGEALAPFLVPGGERVADAQVALDADAGEEEDAAVEVGVELEADEAAGKIAEGPVILLGIVVDQQRERTDVKEVGHRQVQHVDHGSSQDLPGHPDLDNDHEVQRQPQPQDDGVHHRQQDLLELFMIGAGILDGSQRRVVVHPRTSGGVRLHHAMQETWS